MKPIQALSRFHLLFLEGRKAFWRQWQVEHPRTPLKSADEINTAVQTYHDLLRDTLSGGNIRRRDRW